jgi:hypothetical protein
MARRIGGAGGGSDPGGGISGGVLAIAVAGALALGGVGAGGLTGGTAVTGESPGGPDLSVRNAEGRKSARKGDSRQAWERMGMRELRKVAKQDLTCVEHSRGRVREYFLRAPCTSLDRIVFAVGDGHGDSMFVSVEWVGFRTKTQAAEFKKVEDAPDSGDIVPLGGSLLTMADVHFSGNHYKSRLDGKTVVIAETETAVGQFGDTVLDTVADVAVYLPDVEHAKR